jgi:ABC-type iron transport system FetAB permease component
MSDATYRPKVYRKQGGDELVVASGGVITVESGGSIAYNPVKRLYRAGAKAGATSGWAVAGTTNIADITLPASQSGSTLVIPITGLRVGDTITGFSLVGQIESAGGTVTVDAALRKLTSAAADNVDASVGAITQLSVTADTAMSSANAGKTSLTEVVGENEAFYVLVTATTAASTDISLMGVVVTTTSSITAGTQQMLFRAGAKVGATSGWVVAGTTNIADITCPASQTAATLVIPITGLRVGDTITAFSLVGQVESAGNTATVDADLRKLTAAAADNTDASVGAITQVVATADTLLSETTAKKASLAEVVGEDEAFYVLVTVTTAASTDVSLLGVLVTVSQP